MKRHLFAAAMLAAFLASAADAATLTQVYQQPLALPVGWSIDPAFAQFNPALGTLTGVRFDVAGSVVALERIENFVPQPVIAAFFGGADLTLTAPGAGALILPLPWLGMTTWLAAFDGTFDYDGASAASDSGSYSGVGGWDLTDLTPFTGTGTIGGLSLGTAGHFSQNELITNEIAIWRKDFVSASVALTYTFDPAIIPPPPTGAVPEPASWAMLIAGFGLVGAAQRRRSAGVAA